jgi:7-carboxy-7-deazaguanine synthase
MVINEIFYSLQGEGFLAGLPSVFVRIAGCPLRCRWCDTKYAWAEDAGQDRSVAEIVEAVEQWRCRFVVITGGEPMVSFEIRQLARELKAADRHITIETAGIAYIPDVACDLMSISPKLSNSVPAEAALATVHKDSRLDLAVLGELIANYHYQLKFVVDSVNDVPEIQEVIEQTGNIDPAMVMLMPQAAKRDELSSKSPVVAEICKSTGLAFCQRLHILLWDAQRGT